MAPEPPTTRQVLIAIALDSAQRAILSAGFLTASSRDLPGKVGE
jgi:hypothetical protein